MSLVSDLQTLEPKSVDEIYRIIGDQLLSKTLGADEFSDDEVKEEAISWYDQVESKLRGIICQSRIYAVYVKNPTRWEWVMIAAAIADLIAPTVSDVSPVSVAALIVKKGLDNLCEDKKAA